MDLGVADRRDELQTWIRSVVSQHDTTEIGLWSVVTVHDTPHLCLRYVASVHDTPHSDLQFMANRSCSSKAAAYPYTLSIAIPNSNMYNEYTHCQLKEELPCLKLNIRNASHTLIKKKTLSSSQDAFEFIFKITIQLFL